MKTVDDIIKALGGTDRATELCGISIAAIEKWRQKGTVPPKHWPKVVAGSSGKVRYVDLAGLAS